MKKLYIAFDPDTNLFENLPSFQVVKVLCEKVKENAPDYNVVECQAGFLEIEMDRAQVQSKFLYLNYEASTPLLIVGVQLNREPEQFPFDYQIDLHGLDSNGTVFVGAGYYYFTTKEDLDKAISSAPEHKNLAELISLFSK